MARHFILNPAQRLKNGFSRLVKILEGKAELMAGGMRISATVKKLTDKERKPVDAWATYLKNKAPFLKYHRYLDMGLPIAPGVIEPSCKGSNGYNWSIPSAKAVLRPCALGSSTEINC